MELAQSDLFEQLVLETPWPVSAALLLAALVLWWHSGRRDDRLARRLSPLVALLAVAVAVTGVVVTTPAEQMVHRARQLVNATAPLEPDRLAQLIDPDAVLLGPDGDPWLESGDVLVEELTQAIARWKPQRHVLVYVDREMDSPNRGRTDLHIRTLLENRYARGPVHTHWRVVWTRRANEPWRVQTVQWVELQRRPPQRGIWR